ncbi:MAG TPA: MerR family transcriptional regulator [Polyangia bacterium]|jgi:DNA-binding transcriptional MerR regulator
MSDGPAASESAQLVLPIPEKAYFRIGEVARILGVKPYVLRFWETEFRVVRPQKTRSQQRVYRRRDVELLREIRRLLYDERYTIEGARKRLREDPESPASTAAGEAEPAAPVAAAPAPRGPRPESFEKSFENVKNELEEILKLLAE